jgi:uncharacterized protein YjbI with pentapeptide repeats
LLELQKNTNSLDVSSVAATIVRSRTPTTLKDPDGHRKGTLTRFLLEARLLKYYVSKPKVEQSNTAFEITGADLSDADLRGLSFGNIDLSDVDLSKADLRHAKLADTRVSAGTKLPAKWKMVRDIFEKPRRHKLRSADLTDANLSGASLRGADLRSTRLQRANLESADLDDADLRGADLRDANLKLVLVRRTRFSWRTRIDQKNRLIWRVANRTLDRLAGADLADGDFSFLSLPDVRLAAAELTGCNFQSTTLVRADLDGALAVACRFDDANLRPPDIA